jgi:hypothetical protein
MPPPSLDRLNNVELMSESIDRCGFRLHAVMVREKNQIRAGIDISGDHAKAFFGLLKRQKDAIERGLGYRLEWEELPDGNGCRIASYLDDVDPADKADWPSQHAWMTKRLDDMHRVFADRIAALDAGGWKPKGEH